MRKNKKRRRKRSIGEFMDNFQKTLEILLKIEIAKIHELDRLNHLIEEFMDVNINFLLWIREYCDTHNIPLWKENEFSGQVEIIRKILKEIKETSEDIEGLIESRQLPLNKFHKRSPEDLPEPEKLFKK
jgi:hypothetical protein